MWALPPRPASCTRASTDLYSWPQKNNRFHSVDSAIALSSLRLFDPFGGMASPNRRDKGDCVGGMIRKEMVLCPGSEEYYNVRRILNVKSRITFADGYVS